MATLTEPIDRLPYLIARSSTWRTMCGINLADPEATQLAEALEHVHELIYLSGDLPFVRIEYGTAESVRHFSGGAAFVGSWELETYWYQTFTSQDDGGDVVSQLSTFRSNLKSVVNEMLALSGGGTHLQVDNAKWAKGPQHATPESEVQVMEQMITFSGKTFGSQDE